MPSTPVWEAGKSVRGGGKKGVLITIDETQAASYDDAVAIATAIQHVIADTDESDIPDADKKAWR